MEKIDDPLTGHHFDIEVLVALDEAGGHCEALSPAHRQALRVLTDERLVRRVVYPAGLVIYEITDAGRRLSAAGHSPGNGDGTNAIPG